MCEVLEKNTRLMAEYNYEADILRTAFLGRHTAESLRIQESLVDMPCFLPRRVSA